MSKGSVPMEVQKILNEYDLSKLSVATAGSHSALQILHGAKKEGLRTVLIVKKDRLDFYRTFSHFIDEFIIIENWSEILEKDVKDNLIALNSIIIPHGSFVEYVGSKNLQKYEVPIFGSRKILEWEATQEKKMELLRRAGIRVPKEFKSPEEVDRLVIVKLGGAKGGRGYFLASTPEEVKEGLEKLGNPSNYIIQEYVIGVPAYYHVFNSKVYNRIEITGMDIRYESNVDGLRRLPPKYASKVSPTFTVVGNIPMVLRESLLITVYNYAKSFVEVTKEVVGEEIVGPFCLESIITENGEIVVFEFSGRIVAGTNVYIDGSPYSYLYWDEPMSVGRRIAREIRKARDKGMLEEILR
ncbi:5-formaminoimidazole-4-carboxamide-1-(beta)-D-ribofuranosyl 5'-monophosphate synthetase [Ignicoccus pacificus DSM 13166]|uniref:5-formaminoimidazole-4-carboxamide-1-(beta)-D-ribofuranosyl 5'-monophosphate synthetase n=1 Tax=Ignicoccus pacificus DSM 13166 TaxID=940294 RepID=A0A977PKA7_9CREN|nr:5-formaminoimidazole-4-carboxamide-1-(beta)-D-ribofuranosyl 5'-monophosphate synthetase [Ignicoccus pacificus DSM 13166]